MTVWVPSQGLDVERNRRQRKEEIWVSSLPPNESEEALAFIIVSDEHKKLLAWRDLHENVNA